MNKAPRFHRILVVDDEEDTQAMVGWVFKDLGYEVDLAADGWTAIDKIEKSRPDLMVLDLVLPGVDGWSLLEHVKTLPAPPPVVVMTACGDSESFTCAVREGAAGFVFKPFRMGDLVATCERILFAGMKGASSAWDERRQEPRRVLALDLKAQAADRPAVARGKLVDLSRRGAQVDLAAALEPGEKVRITFQIPDRESPLLSMEGRIRWRGLPSPGFPHGMAFENLAPEAGRRLQELFYPA